MRKLEREQGEERRGLVILRERLMYGLMYGLRLVLVLVFGVLLGYLGWQVLWLLLAGVVAALEWLGPEWLGLERLGPEWGSVLLVLLVLGPWLVLLGLGVRVLLQLALEWLLVLLGVLLVLLGLFELLWLGYLGYGYWGLWLWLVPEEEGVLLLGLGVLALALALSVLGMKRHEGPVSAIPVLLLGPLGVLVGGAVVVLVVLSVLGMKWRGGPEVLGVLLVSGLLGLGVLLGLRVLFKRAQPVLRQTEKIMRLLRDFPRRGKKKDAF